MNTLQSGLEMFGHVYTAIAIALLSTGCSTVKSAHPGPQLPETEVAIVAGYSEHGLTKLDTLLINAVDGKWFAHFNDYPHEVHLLPGVHRLTIELHHARPYFQVRERQQLEVTVQAGEKYRIKYIAENDKLEPGNKITFWVENERTGDKVSGTGDGDTDSTGEAPANNAD